MSNNAVLVDVSHVTKRYYLGVLGSGTLKQDFQDKMVALFTRHQDKTLASRSSKPELLALNDVSFKLYEGERLAILGSNGSGKSTLIKMMSNITLPTSGSISVYDKLVSLIALTAGFSGELTLTENILMRGAILGLSYFQVKSRIDKILDYAELSKFRETPLKRLSSGMVTRLGISLILELIPRILIMDEVLSVGDIAFRDKVLATLQTICNAHPDKAMVLVSHLRSQIQDFAERAIVLKKGKLIFDGPIDQALSVYNDGNY